MVVVSHGADNWMNRLQHANTRKRKRTLEHTHTHTLGGNIAAALWCRNSETCTYRVMIHSRCRA